MIALAPVALPHPGFAALRDEGAAGDGAFLARLEREWREGALRFDRHDEILLGASNVGRLVGVGGISLDPYEPAAGLCRLRHLYVQVDARRRGIGRALVLALLDHARGHFAAVRLRTHQAPAARLYERCGFAPSCGAFESHRLVL